MLCNQKFGFGHNCIKTQLYNILMDGSDAIKGEHEEFVDYMEQLEDVGQKDQSDIDSPIISLHVLTGTEGCQTMRVLGKIKRQSVVMLIDSSGTNNFIN